MPTLYTFTKVDQSRGQASLQDGTIVKKALFADWQAVLKLVQSGSLKDTRFTYSAAKKGKPPLYRPVE